jgi:hypothetical protein
VRQPCCSFRRGAEGKITHVRELLEQILWFTEYLEEIETDFAAIYGILDVESLPGRKFVRFARRLIYYEGAVLKKMQMDYNESSESSTPSAPQTQETGPTTKMSMGEAMKKYNKGTHDDLDALNYESQSAMGGTLFERVTVPKDQPL